MPPTPNKLNLSFARNAYNVFGSRHVATTNEHQREQKTELLEGKEQTERRSELHRKVLRSPLIVVVHELVSPFVFTLGPNLEQKRIVLSRSLAATILDDDGNIVLSYSSLSFACNRIIFCSANL